MPIKVDASGVIIFGPSVKQLNTTREHFALTIRVPHDAVHPAQYLSISAPPRVLERAPKLYKNSIIRVLGSAKLTLWQGSNFAVYSGISVFATSIELIEGPSDSAEDVSDDGTELSWLQHQRSQQ